jgi:hypothetical protein
VNRLYVLVGAVAASGLIATASALPGDRAPVVVKAQMDGHDPGKAFPGGVVKLDGRNFGEKKEEIVVSIDGKECFVPDCKEVYLHFVVPAEMPVGKHEVKVTHKPDSLSTTFKLEVVKKTEKERKEETDKLEGGGTEEKSMFDKRTEGLEAKITLVPGDAPAIIVDGTTPNHLLPDDFELQVTVGFSLPQGLQTMDMSWKSQQVKIKNGAFQVKYGPYPGKALLAGRYYVDVMFDIKQQSMIVLKKNNWPKKLTPMERAGFEEIKLRRFVESLTDADRQKQDEEHRLHYVDLAARTTTLVIELERAYASAGKSFFRKGTTVDDAAWQEWVAHRQFGPDDMKRIEKDARFVTKTYQLDAERWQSFIENEIYKNLQEIAQRHTNLKNKYVGSRDPQAETLGDHLISIILGLAHYYSTELYQRNKLQLPDSLRGPKEMPADFENPLKLSRSYFESQKKQLLERFPATPTPPPGAPAKKDEKKDDKPAENPK